MKKLNLNEVKKLSREEMKKIMAGSGCITSYKSCSFTTEKCCAGTCTYHDFLYGSVCQ